MLNMDRFAEFYETLYSRSPFPWQIRLAQRVGTGEWPAAIALPTAAGKTTCIDIAVFALACRAPNAARRIFFIVDRRIVVDQAYEYAKSLSQQLIEPKSDIVAEVAAALKDVAQDNKPLDVYALRGGMYRETAWVRSPLQPTIIASTVDQIGSRLLFRGYGVTESMMPIHAGLVGNDSLILLDEAHCAKPFDQTVRAVQKYRSWHANKHPFRCVSITATPTVDGPVERDSEEDRSHPVLGKRIKAKKPAKLIVAEKAKGKNGATEQVKVLKAEAEDLAKTYACVGIFVNRVATARELAKALGEGTVLLTGRMRPLDRDKLYQDKLQSLLSDSNETPPKYVVGTQCLECGADFDFHALVTECASLDALRQRFGRLNRIARREVAEARIVIRADQTDDTSEDPVYGESLANTWKWLKSKASNDVVDFGIAPMRELLDHEPTETVAQLNAPTSNAPVLLPAYLDCWVQTHPIPEPDPDVALFLHGPVKPGQPDVQVVFREDLGSLPDRWADVVTLIPPSSSEAVAVPINVFRRWLKGEEFQDTTSDVEGEATDDDGSSQIKEPREALEWNGLERSILVRGDDKVKPNGTYIIPTQATGWELLGDFPYGLTDQAEDAYLRSRDKRVFRFRDFTLKEDHEDYEATLKQMIQDRTKEPVTSLKKQWDIELYPEPLVGVVVIAKQRLRQFDPTILDEPDDSYRSSKAVTLEQHCQGVAAFARKFATGCGLDADLFEQAGLWHDLGKLDPRFQAMLRQMSPRTSVGAPLAKSERVPKTSAEREEARTLHGYPKGARHELLSAAMLAAECDDDLLLHLVATHHGAGRPFAHPVDDANMVPFKKPPGLYGKLFSCNDARQQIAEWNAILPERFWRMVNQFGWWGLAYQEAIFRLADHSQSKAESEGKQSCTQTVQPDQLKMNAAANNQSEIELTGIDGTSPLGFMAAIGILRLITEVQPDAKLSWVPQRSRPILALEKPIDIKTLSQILHMQLHRAVDPVCLDDAKRLYKEFRSDFKKLQDATNEVKARKLKGKNRDEAMKELSPLESEVNASRNRWLESLDKSSPFPYMALGKSISVTQDEFLNIATRIVEKLHASRNRRDSDFIASFACDACTDKNGKVIPTEFQFITGSGHQYFLETMSELSQHVTWEQVHQSIFKEWKNADDGFSFRWDPVDDKRYALKWEDPSNLGVRSEHGANILAVNALPAFVVAPQQGNVKTTGFSRLKLGRALTWPLWSKPLSYAAIRSILQSKTLTCESPRDTESLNIATVMRAWKIQVGTPPLMKLNISNAFSI